MLVKDINPGSGCPASSDERQRHAVLHRQRRHSWLSSCGRATAPRPAPCWSRTSIRACGDRRLVNQLPHERQRDAVLHAPTTAPTATSCGRATAPRPAPCWSRTSSPAAVPVPSVHLTNVNGTLFFTANDGTHGHELWKSDGTAAGTVLVKDIIPGIRELAVRSI